MTHFGIDLGGYFRFHDMDTAFKDLKMGLDGRNLESIRYHLKELSDIVDKVAGAEKPVPKVE